jgi:MarR family 2-MHQ and catechol resistance regulon transcriptional repressor
LPVNTIGPKVWLTPGSISVAVDRLEQKGAGEAQDHRDDRRVRRVELTPKGRPLITKTFREHAAAMAEVAAVLSKEDRLTLMRLLKKRGKAGMMNREHLGSNTLPSIVGTGSRIHSEKLASNHREKP